MNAGIVPNAGSVLIEVGGSRAVEQLVEECLLCGRWVRLGMSGRCDLHHLRSNELATGV